MDQPPPFPAPHTTSLPGEALPFVWVLVIGAMALWWLLPFLERLRAPSTTAPAAEIVRGATVAAAAARAGSSDGSVAEHDSLSWDSEIIPSKTGSGITVDGLAGHDLACDFEATFLSAAELIDQALQVAPQGPEYNRATAALRRLSEIIDAIFRAWGTEELTRVCRLKEEASSFRSAFGCNSAQGGCTAARKLLELAGFERHEQVAGQGVWVFPAIEGCHRLRAMSVRLSLQKYDDLQKRRGSKVWTQTSNADVVPKLESAALMELFGLYCADGGATVPSVQLSLKERNTEAEVRAELNRRRAQAAAPLGLHGGLAAVARSLATSVRLRARQTGKAGGSRPPGPSNAEVSALLAKLALPPGFTAVHLHYVTDELPHVFGLASTRGDGEGASDSDKVAEIIANEVGSAWSAWQSASLVWPFGLVCGIGASLDYTINRGFIVAIIAGFEGFMPQGELAAAVRQERLQLKQRQESAKEHRPNKGFGASVQGVKDIPQEPRRRAGPSGG